MKRIACFLIFSLFYIISFAQNRYSLDAEIIKVLERYQSVGVSAVVVKDNEIIYTRSYGYNPDYNDTTLRIAIPTNGVFVIQSISKSFIGTAIMQLVEKGLISLDDDVNKYLDFNIRNPQYPQVPITIRMLLCHRSTINDRHYAWNFNQIDSRKGYKWKECYNDYEPGTKFNYCNLNYNLLGAIIEKVTGQPFFEYIDENITRPLGLNGSFNLTKIDSSLIVKALIYNKKSKVFKKDPLIYNYDFYKKKLNNYELCNTTACFSPSGGMKISIVDLAKYMMMHMNYGELNGVRIISKESELKMREPQGPDKEGDTYFHNYGFAFSSFEKPVKGESLVGVTGGAHGIYSAIYFHPEERYGFAVVCNGSTTGIKLIDCIVGVLYDNLILNK